MKLALKNDEDSNLNWIFIPIKKLDDWESRQYSKLRDYLSDYFLGELYFNNNYNLEECYMLREVLL